MEEFSGDDLSGLNWRQEKGEYIKTFSYITYFKMLSMEELRSLRRKKRYWFLTEFMMTSS